MDPETPGAYVNDEIHLNSGRFSEAETVATRQTDTTFTPPQIGTSPGDAFRTPIAFEEQAPPKRLNVNTLYNDNYAAVARKKLQKRILLAILLFSLIAIVGSVTFLVTAESSEDDFCATQSVTDVEMRELLRDDFDEAVNAGAVGEALFTSTSLVCLPSSAFDLLSDVQKTTLTDLDLGLRISTGLSSIHSDAFDSSLVEGHVRLNLIGNSLTELPDGVFRNFQSMTSLTLTGNPFVTLSNDITENLPNLEEIGMNDMEDLEEFPEFMHFSTAITVVSLVDCTSLVTANSVAFEGLDVARLSLSNGGTPVLDELGVNGLAQALEIDNNVIDVV